MKKKPTIAVVGCGLGGATVAALLQKYDYNIVVFEQSKSFVPAGAGIHISPNAMRIMRHIGLDIRLQDQGHCPSAFTSRSWDTGEILFNLPLGEEAKERYSGVYLTVHRGDFHSALISAIKPGTVHFCKRLKTLHQSDDCVTLQFEDGYQIKTDFVIGADGLSSVVRQILIGKSSPTFSGQIAFRSILPTSQLKSKPLDDLTKWWAPDRFVISYYLTKNKDLFYFVAGLPADKWESTESSIEGSHQELMDSFTGFHPAVLDLLKCSTNQRIWPLFEREPQPIWNDKRVVLLGDACHPMRPHMAQGAAMAIEDAAILVRCLEMTCDHNWESAFKRYSAARINRTAEVQKQSGENTWLREPMDPAWVFSYDALTEPIDNIL